MVSWCHMPGPAPQGAVACGPRQARAAQYRSKCNALLRSARTPSPLCSLSVQGRTARAVPHGPHGSDDVAVLVLCSGTHPMQFSSAKRNTFRMDTHPMPAVLLHGHTPNAFNSAKNNILRMCTHPMPSVLPKVINFAWAHTQCLQFCCMGTHPMPSVLPKVINFAWAHAQCLQICQK